MSFTLDFLIMRRPKLNYVSPPVCEVIFSSTGVVIILDPINPLGAPTGLELGGEGGNKLVWDVFPHNICYNVYESVNADDPFGPYVLVSECNPDPVYPDPKPRCYRVSAITLDGESALSDPFCISTTAPTVSTEPATDIQNTSAILNGIVNPNGFSCSAYFQWGTDFSYGSQTAPQPAGSGFFDLNFDDLITGLSQNTTYHFRAVATNGEFTIFGGDREFTTPGGGDDPCGTGLDIHILGYDANTTFDNPPPPILVNGTADIAVGSVGPGDVFSWSSALATFNGPGFLNMFGIWFGGIFSSLGGTGPFFSQITDVCTGEVGSPAVGSYLAQTVFSSRDYSLFPVWDGHFPLTNTNGDLDPFGNPFCAVFEFGCLTVDGYLMANLTLARDETGPVTVWTLSLTNGDGNLIWEGTLTAEDLQGLYTRTSGSSLIPATLTLTV